MKNSKCGIAAPIHLTSPNCTVNLSEDATRISFTLTQTCAAPAQRIRIKAAIPVSKLRGKSIQGNVNGPIIRALGLAMSAYSSQQFSSLDWRKLLVQKTVSIDCCIDLKDTASERTCLALVRRLNVDALVCVSKLIQNESLKKPIVWHPTCLLHCENSGTAMSSVRRISDAPKSLADAFSGVATAIIDGDALRGIDFIVKYLDSVIHPGDDTSRENVRQLAAALAAKWPSANDFPSAGLSEFTKRLSDLHAFLSMEPSRESEYAAHLLMSAESAAIAQAVATPQAKRSMTKFKI